MLRELQLPQTVTVLPPILSEKRLPSTGLIGTSILFSAFISSGQLMRHRKNFRSAVLVRQSDSWCLRWSIGCHYLQIWTSPLLFRKIFRNKNNKQLKWGNCILRNSFSDPESFLFEVASFNFINCGFSGYSNWSQRGCLKCPCCWDSTVVLSPWNGQKPFRGPYIWKRRNAITPSTFSIWYSVGTKVVRRFCDSETSPCFITKVPSCSAKARIFVSSARSKSWIRWWGVGRTPGLVRSQWYHKKYDFVGFTRPDFFFEAFLSCWSMSSLEKGPIFLSILGRTLFLSKNFWAVRSCLITWFFLASLGVRSNCAFNP